MPSDKLRAAPAPPPQLLRSLDLARFRKRADLTLEQIADRTKISVRFLRAIESEEFEKLPGGIFSTSYLRQYAQSIGYDEAELLGHFERKMNPQTPSKRPQSEHGGRRFLDRWLRVAAQAQQ